MPAPPPSLAAPVPGTVTLRPAIAGDEALFDRLLQFYAYDFSALETPGSGWIDLDAKGRFAVHLRQEPVAGDTGSHLILRHDKVAGFVTIDRQNPSGQGTDWNIAEFFILAKYRRHGIGTAAVTAMLATRPGRWEAAVMPENTRALAFWHQTLRPWRATQVPGSERWQGKPVLRFVV